MDEKREYFQTEQALSNSATLAHEVAARRGKIASDIGLRINRSNDEFEFILFGPRTSEHGFEQGYSQLTPEEVFLYVDECRRTWLESVVNLSAVDQQSNSWFPFRQTHSPVATDANLKGLIDTNIMPRLAVAGERLFSLIFENKCDADLTKIGEYLRDLCRSSRTIAITSDELFLPWGMIYTHPDADGLAADGANWRKQGFWGYAHKVWQDTRRHTLRDQIVPTQPLLSVNVDADLPTTLKLPIVQQHFDEMLALVSGAITRRTSKEVADMFINRREKIEAVMYFFCHGTGARSRGGPNLGDTFLTLTGNQQISSVDLQAWAKKKKLPTQPLVFINACQGGQMGTLFYNSLARELLEQEAIGVIGPQLDIPAVFAVEFGKRILQRFLNKDSGERVVLGDVMQRVCRDSFDAFANPLGFTYTLYRGVNCSIDWKGEGQTP